MNKETSLGHQIHIALSKLGFRMFRYQIGLFYTRNGTPIKIGVPGVSDYIGYKPTLITQDMVGKTIAVFVGCEIKTPKGKISDDQDTFIWRVNLDGGQAFVVRSVSDVVEKLSNKP